MSSNKADYKSSKEAFVSGATGSTVTHVNFISAVALCSIALYAAVRSRLSSLNQSNLVLEWTILVLPLLLSMTLFAEMPLLLCTMLLILTAILFSLPWKDYDEPPLSPSVSRTSSFSGQSTNTSPPPSNSRIIISQLPSLTVYRAHMLLMTFLAILAVDFPVFPRSLAKCETFGVSLMDLGVGSFVFSQGVVSAISLLKDPMYLLVPPRPKVLAVVKKVLPVFALGVIRVISVKGTEYPEHESEYGTHWNFFFTLAILPILQVLLHPIMIYLPISLWGFLVALCHQLALSLTPLQQYTLTASRGGLLSANKEGLVSLTGYLAIHLLGLSVGTLILPLSPSDFRRQQNRLRLRLRGIDSAPPSPTIAHSENANVTRDGKKVPKRQDDKTILELFSYAFLWWTCLAVCYWMNTGGWVSRRLANLPYVIWVAAYNTSFIMFYLLLDKLSVSRKTSSSFSPISPSSLHPGSYVSGGKSKSKSVAPSLLEAINLNGLALFLLANVATGLINLSVSTMYASDGVAMVILSLYSFALCAVAWTFRKARLWKF
ncbi:GWT1_3 [Sanghuangporus weigelae]